MPACLLYLLPLLWLSACASLPSEVARPISTGLANPSSTRLGQGVEARARKAGTRNDSGFALVSTAELAFTSRMALIRAAQKTLDLQYYAVHFDDSTERLFEALREAASRGVRVRILLDDFNTAGKNVQVLKLAFEKNIEVRLFNPLPSGRALPLFRIISSLGDVAKLQRRMHNKIFVADNAVAITGGRNLGDTYFGQSDGTNFVDLDVLAAGRIARDLSRSFDQYWNNPLAYPVQSLMTAQDIEAIKPKNKPGVSNVGAATDRDTLSVPATAATNSPASSPDSTPVNATTTARIVSAPSGATSTIAALPDDTDLRLLPWTWAPSVMLADKASKIALDADSVQAGEDTVVDDLLGLMAKAKTDGLIVSAYFVPGKQMMRQFADLRQRGVRVRVLTNSLASNDAPAAHAGYARYRQALIAMGVEIYELRTEQPATVAAFGSAAGSAGNSSGASRASLHAKAVVIDGSLLVIGSMNLDLRSKLQNSEVAVVIRSTKLSLEATRLIEPGLAHGAYRVELEGGQLVWRAPQGSGLKDTTTEPDASLGLRLMVNLIAPFAPDEML
ncbi:MAG: phospholipase D family protein [Polaromonas sp.]|nr:MAG: phospholipase D family protein [Polaromonas sp.]